MADAGDRVRKSYSQAQRLLKIYMALANSRHGVTIAELEDQTGVTRRTLNRDLALLGEDHLVEAREGADDNRKRWMLLPAGPASTISFTKGELMALHLGRSMLAFARGTELGEAMSSAFDKVTSRLGAGTAGDLARKYYALPDAPPVEAGSERFDDVLNEVQSALDRGQRLELRYPQGSDGASRDLVVDPLTMAYFRGRLYLLALCDAYPGPHPFALHRVIGARWLRGEAAAVPAGYSPEEHFSSSFGLFTGGEPVTVRVHFAPSAARYARERRWHASQRVVDLQGGGCEISWELPLTPDLESWLLSFGDSATVQAPAALRRTMRARLQRALAAYDDLEPDASNTRGETTSNAASEAARSER